AAVTIPAATSPAPACFLAVESMTRIVCPAPVSSPVLPLRALKTSSIGVGLASAILLAWSAIALAEPAGSEYLPKVPTASGNAASGGAGSQSSQGGTTVPTTASSEAGPSKTTNSKGTETNGKKREAAVAPAASSGDGSSGGGSSGLWVILLIVAGVIVTAVGMTLRRRQGDDPGATGDEDRPARSADDMANTPQTPDGEIVAGRDK